MHTHRVAMHVLKQKGRIINAAVGAAGTMPLYNNTSEQIFNIMSVMANISVEPLVKSATYSIKGFASSFNDAQAEKEDRYDTKGAIVGHIKEKYSALSNEEKQSIAENLKSSKDDHKSRSSDIKKFGKAAKFVRDTITPIVENILQSKVTEKEASLCLKVLGGASKFALRTLPVLNAMNNLSLAMDTLQALYPEESEAVKTYVNKQLQEVYNKLGVDDFKTRFRMVVDRDNTPSSTDDLQSDIDENTRPGNKL